MQDSPFSPVPGSCFVTGTGTDVGKTVVAAALVAALGADYWKPVQSGTDELPAGDAGTVARLAALGEDRLVPTVYAFKAPLSPDQAAAREQMTIDLSSLTLPRRERPLVVEGAGGILVPLSRRHTMVHLMARLLLPVVVVAPSGLGTINHTLLTLEGLRHRNLPVAGVIFSGPPHPDNAESVARLGAVRVLGTLPRLDPLTPAALALAAQALDLSPLIDPPTRGFAEF